jgi:hypothetical protein
MKLPSYVLPSVLLLAVSSCTQGNTEEESLGISLEPLFFSAAEKLESGSRALVGSHACVELDSFKSQDDGWSLLSDAEEDCYEVTWSAPEADDECLYLEELGEQLVEITPRDDCGSEAVAAAAVPDRFRLQVVGPDGLRGRLEWWQERLAEIHLHPGPRGSFPSDWIPAVDEPLRLVPDVEVMFPVVLVDAAGGGVARDTWLQLFEYRDGVAPRVLEPLEDGSVLFPVSIGAGERSTLTLEVLLDVELPVAEVEATPVDHAASLAITVAYEPEREPEQWAAPYAARALVRDAEGHMMLGAPVVWSLVEGHLAMVPGGDGDVVVGPPEYLSLADACVAPPAAPQARRAILRAELGTLVDEVELEWTAFPEEEPSDEPFEADLACQLAGDADELEARGCRCTTRSSGDLGWMAWAVVRRRRAVGG